MAKAAKKPSRVSPLRLAVTSAIAGPIVTGIFSIAVVVLQAQTLHFAQVAAGEGAAAQIRSISAAWTGSRGQYVLSGRVTGLQVGQSVWQFVQPSEYPVMYPGVGPCPVDSAGAFTCPVGDTDGPQRVSYRLYVAVADAAQAAEIVKHLTYSKASGNADFPFASVGDIPHLLGTGTLKSIDAGAAPG